MWHLLYTYQKTNRDRVEYFHFYSRCIEQEMGVRLLFCRHLKCIIWFQWLTQVPWNSSYRRCRQKGISIACDSAPQPDGAALGNTQSKEYKMNQGELNRV